MYKFPRRLERPAQSLAIMDLNESNFWECVKAVCQNILSKAWRYLQSIKFIMTYRLCFGLYYDFSTSKVICRIGKVYCTALFICQVLIFTIGLAESPFPSKLHGGILLLHIILYFLLSLYTKEKYFFKYCEKVEALDHDLGHTSESKSFMAFVQINVQFGLEFIRFLFAFSNVLIVDLSFLARSAIFFSIMSAITTKYLPVTIIFDCLYNKLQILKKELKHDLKNNTEEEKCYNIRDFINAYKCLQNIFKAAVVPKYLFIGVCFYIFGRMIALAYYYVEIVTNQTFLSILILSFGIALELSIIFIPALLLDLASKELDEIKSILTTHLIMCKENKLLYITQDALDYATVNPVTMKLWSNFTFDLNLCLGLVNIISLYIISILQFKY